VRSDRLERWARSDGFKRWAPRVCLAFGVGLLVACPVAFVHTERFVAGAEHATGTVIDLSRETDSEGRVTLYPVVRFTTADGRTVQFLSSSGSSSPPEVGDSVDVLYDPDDPRDAQLSGFFDLWLFPLVFGGLGIAFTTVGLFAPGFGLIAGRFGFDRFAESS
jgi:Protein of unknown function (DUF3592)